MTSRVFFFYVYLCGPLGRSNIFPDSLEESETDTSEHASSEAFLEVSVRYQFPAQARGKTYPDTSGKWRFYIKSIDFDVFLEVSVRYRFPAECREIMNRHLRPGPQSG